MNNADNSNNKKEDPLKVISHGKILKQVYEIEQIKQPYVNSIIKEYLKNQKYLFRHYRKKVITKTIKQ